MTDFEEQVLEGFSTVLENLDTAIKNLNVIVGYISYLEKRMGNLDNRVANLGEATSEFNKNIPMLFRMVNDLHDDYLDRTGILKEAQRSSDLP